MMLVRIAQFFFVACALSVPALSQTKILNVDRQNPLRGLGVNIHTHSSFPPSLSGIKDAGFNTIRTNIYWNHVEKERGQYDWSNYDKLVDLARRQNIKVLFSISFSNGLYERSIQLQSMDGKRTVKKFAPPTSPVGRAAFAKFAAAAAARYKTAGLIWEIWNEPNYFFFWPPTPDAHSYAQLAETSCKAIKQADPNATVVGPSSAGMPSDPGNRIWWTTLASSGAFRCLDGVSVHPYVNNYYKGPEINVEKYRDLRSLLSLSGHGNLPVISSEFGYSSYTGGGVSERRQASLLVRNFLVNLDSDVGTSIWYDWRNDGNEASEKEHNFGISTRSETPKDGLIAALTLSRTLSGMRFASCRTRDGLIPSRTLYALRKRGIWSCSFVGNKGRRRVVILWSASQSTAPLHFPSFSGKTFKVIDVMGKEVPPPEGARLDQIAVGPDPVYVVFDRL